MKFEEIVSLCPNYRLAASGDFNQIGLKNKPYPLSVTEEEAFFMYDYIINNNLKNGFEIATGTGASAIIIGLAMKQTGGRLTTMDGYGEELYSRTHDYEETRNENSLALEALRSMISCLELPVFPVVGWSPQDTFLYASKNLDFLMIDALHTYDGIWDDYKSLKPYLGDRFAIFFHDILPVHPGCTAAANQIAEELNLELKSPPIYSQYGLKYVEKL